MELKKKQNILGNLIAISLVVSGIILIIFNFDFILLIEHPKSLAVFIVISSVTLIVYRRFNDEVILLMYDPVLLAAFLVYGPSFALVSFILPMTLYMYLSEGPTLQNFARLFVQAIKLFIGGFLYFGLLDGSSGMWLSPWHILYAALTALAMTSIEDIGYLLLDISKKSSVKNRMSELIQELKRFPFFTAWGIMFAYLVRMQSYYFAAIMLILAAQIYLYLAQQQELQSTLKNAFFSLTRMINMRDQYTYQHSLSVAVYAKLVALELGYSEKFAEELYQMGLLHDIGKVGISDTILLKDSTLTNEEYSKMKEHPSLGAKLVRLLKFLDVGTDGIRNHHEYYDGKGYPDGLKGESIPLSARIIAVCDAWNAMRTDRPYRKALSYEKAMEQIRWGVGTQFDPEVVRAALKIFKKEEPGIKLSKTQIFALDR